MRDVTIKIPELHPTQAAVKSKAKRFNVLCCGRRWGKTALCHELMLDTLLEGAPVAYMTPTYKMLADVWRTASEVFQPITSKRNEQERRIETITGGSVDFWSLDNADAVRGRAYKRVIPDEAASVRDLEGVWNTIVRPTLIDLKGDAWFPSTPKGMNGFYKLHLFGRDPTSAEWASFHQTSYDNPYLDPAELDQMRATMTEREYRQEILAEFLEGEGIVFRYIDQAMHALVTTPEEHAKHVLVAGVDWGKQDDFTAISVGCVDCKQEVALDRFNQIDYAFQRQRLMAMLHKWHVKMTVAESNAMGTVVIEQLQRDGVRVTPFQTTLVSKSPLIEALSLAIEQANIQLQADPAARAELEAYERTTNKDRH